MAEAILTHYIGPSNTRGGRVVAETGERNRNTGRRDRVIIPYDAGKDIRENHKAAARKLLQKMAWDWVAWTIGSYDRGYIFVRADFSTEDVKPAEVEL